MFKQVENIFPCLYIYTLRQTNIARICNLGRSKVDEKKKFHNLDDRGKKCIEFAKERSSIDTHVSFLVGY